MTLRENKINSIKKEMLLDSIHNQNTFVDLIYLNMIEYIKNIPYGYFEDEKNEGINIKEFHETEDL